MKESNNKQDAKNFKSCIHPPISSGDKNTKILDIIPPPELHLMLGVVNTMVDKMSVEFEQITNDWIKESNVKREVTHGGTGFNGNSCKILLSKIDILRTKSNLQCLKYVNAFSSFKNVVHDCFGSALNAHYMRSIDKFKTYYLDLNISVTPKVHAVFYHIIDYCSEHKRGLGFYSEQAMESVHFDFLSTWSRYKVSPNHAEYDKQLLKAVCAYNSNHV